MNIKYAKNNYKENCCEPIRVWQTFCEVKRCETYLRHHIVVVQIPPGETQTPGSSWWIVRRHQNNNFFCCCCCCSDSAESCFSLHRQLRNDNHQEAGNYLSQWEVTLWRHSTEAVEVGQGSEVKPVLPERREFSTETECNSAADFLDNSRLIRCIKKEEFHSKWVSTKLGWVSSRYIS